MDKNNEEIKECKNCRYYLGRHYVEDNSKCEYVEVCININLNDPKAKRPCEDYEICPLWEDKDSVDELTLALDK